MIGTENILCYSAYGGLQRVPSPSRIEAGLQIPSEIQLARLAGCFCSTYKQKAQSSTAPEIRETQLYVVRQDLRSTSIC